MTTKRIRVLVVDDSAIARKVITESLSKFSDIEVVGTAVDPYNARDRILELSPDVITLDIEMPKMDGITFLKLIMQHRPMPVIIMSSLTTAGSNKAMEALEAGAVDIMDKPSGSFSAHADGSRLAMKIRAAAMARIRKAAPAPAATTTPAKASPGPAPASTSSSTSTSTSPASSRPQSASVHPPRTIPKNPSLARSFPARKIILLGASTGGTEALAQLLRHMSGDLPGICIVQHIPAYFSTAFAARLNSFCPMEVKEAATGDVVRPGLALIAPGGYHMVLKWTGSHYTVDLNQGPPLHHQRPAVDVLFDSAVKAGAAPHAVAALLTGMGADGANGLLHLKENGAQTIAQDEESCVVFGMPREAIRLGAAQHVLPLDQIGSRIERLIAKNESSQQAA